METTAMAMVLVTHPFQALLAAVVLAHAVRAVLSASIEGRRGREAKHSTSRGRLQAVKSARSEAVV
jgi:hypothetical protein